MKDFRVHALDAKYVGPFEQLYIEFKEKVIKDEAEVHIFTGENGTGKSTILYMLAAYHDTLLISPRIQPNYSADFKVEVYYSYLESNNFQKKFNEKILLGIGENGIYRRIGRAFQDYINANSNLTEYKYNFALFAYSGHRKINNPKLESIQEITDHPLLNAQNFTASANAQFLLQWIANVKSKEALTLMAKKNKEANKYKLSLEKLQTAISNIVGTLIKFDLTIEPFDVFVIWNDVQTTFEVLPDGLKSIISWLGDLIMRLDRIEWETEMDIFDRNFVLFLDEIDVHLHPAWQRKILPVVKKLFKNAQIFVSTHSPFVVGSVDGAWVYRLKKEGQYSVLDGEPMLSEDAKSYRLILEETFGIKQQFGESIERKLEEFYELRRRILIGEISFDDTEFQSLAYGLAEQSIELESIIGFELRQLKK